MVQIIETERLKLRPPERQDAEWLAREIANPKVLQWLTTPPSPYRLTDAHDFLESRAGLPNIRVIVGQKPLGVVGLEPTRGAPFELGYWLQESAWGNGYMTEAAGALVDWHFAHHTSDILSGWLSGNDGSANVLEKLGFVREKPVERWANFHGRKMPLERVRLKKSVYARRNA